MSLFTSEGASRSPHVIQPRRKPSEPTSAPLGKRHSSEPTLSSRFHDHLPDAPLRAFTSITFLRNAMDDVPYDVWHSITTFLSSQEVKRLYTLNRSLYNIAMDERYRKVFIGSFTDERTKRNIKRVVYVHFSLNTFSSTHFVHISVTPKFPLVFVISRSNPAIFASSYTRAPPHTQRRPWKILCPIWLTRLGVCRSSPNHRNTSIIQCYKAFFPCLLIGLKETC